MPGAPTPPRNVRPSSRTVPDATYFNAASAVAQRRLEMAANRTQMARDAYTYLHVVIVAGIIVGAVGDELVIAHPGETLHNSWKNNLYGDLHVERVRPVLVIKRWGANPAGW